MDLFDGLITIVCSLGAGWLFHMAYVEIRRDKGIDCKPEPRGL